MKTKTKICTGCKEEKPTSEFYKDHRLTDGLRCLCKKCTSKKSMEGQKKRKDGGIEMYF